MHDRLDLRRGACCNGLCDDSTIARSFAILLSVEAAVGGARLVGKGHDERIDLRSQRRRAQVEDVLQQVVKLCFVVNELLRRESLRTLNDVYAVQYLVAFVACSVGRRVGGLVIGERILHKACSRENSLDRQ